MTEEKSQQRSVWIVAGETSGDGYGASLAREIHRLAPELTVRGMGGPQMRAAGVETFVDSTELGMPEASLLLHGTAEAHDEACGRGTSRDGRPD